MQKAYQQALEFDQLRAVLKDGIAFKGFQEVSSVSFLFQESSHLTRN